MSLHSLVRQHPRRATALCAVVAALPLALCWPPLRHTIEARMVLHMLIEFPLLLAAGGAMQHLCLRHTMLQALARRAALLDWRGWSGGTWAGIVATAWMVPTLLDLALLDPVVAGAKYTSWWLSGWLLVGSLRRIDPGVLLFLTGNITWMMASAGMLYLEAPARLCVNYLQDDQRQTGIGLVALALGLGALALRHLLRSATTHTDEDTNRVRTAAP